MDTDDLYFDNQDDLDIESQLLGDDDDEGDAPEGEPERGRGDLRIALKKEREERRQLREELEAMRRDSQRRDALLEQLGQRQQPQVDPARARQLFADRLVEAPDEVFQQRDQQLLNQVQRLNAPLYIKAAKSDIAEHPEYGEVYRTRPKFKDTIDAYLQNQVNTYGAVDNEALNETLSYLHGIYLEASGGKTTSNDAAKKKLNSIVDKGGNPNGKQSVEQVLEEKSKLAQKGAAGRREYMKWAESPEGKQVLNKALQNGLM